MRHRADTRTTNGSSGRPQVRMSQRLAMPYQVDIPALVAAANPFAVSVRELIAEDSAGRHRQTADLHRRQLLELAALHNLTVTELIDQLERLGLLAKP